MTSRKSGSKVVGATCSLVLLLVGTALSQQKAPVQPPSAASIATGSAIAQALRFREAAAADFSKALKGFRCGKSLDFITNSPLTRARSEAWSMFFASSLVIIGHAENPQPVVAYYNPLYDAVLITRWMPKGDKPEMTAADLRVASLLGKKKGVEPPVRALWLDEMAKTPAPEVLIGHYVSFLKAFEKEFPPAAASLAKVAPRDGVGKAVSFVENQASDAIRNVLAVQRVKSSLYNARLKELRTALAKQDKRALAKLVPKNSPTSLNAILEIPKERAGYFVPCYALLSQTDSMVFLQDTVFPRYYMLVLFKHDREKVQTKTDITSVFFFELEQSTR